VAVVENWDAPGMRATGSHDVVFNDLFVADEQVTGRRTPGEFSPVLAVVAGTTTAGDPGTRRRIGLMGSHLMTARWTLAGVLGELGEDPEPSPATLRTATMAKRTVVELAREVGDLANGCRRWPLLPKRRPARAGVARPARRTVPPARPRTDPPAGRRRRPRRELTLH